MFVFVRKYFGLFGVFVKEMVIFNIGFGFCVSNSIYQHGLKIFFDKKIESVLPPKQKQLKSDSVLRLFGFWVLIGLLTSLKHPSDYEIRKL